ncbi:MAG: hypothetical protein ABFS03_13595 [Chloroflexota bacterium]
MKMVNKDALNSAYRFIKSNADDLYKSLFEVHFFNGSLEDVFNNLSKYQNDDGGFGNGLEPDFLLPDSSPMATTIAFQILDQLGENNTEIVDPAIKYFENTFDRSRSGWWTVPAQVNHHPHAPWWHYDTREKCTVIDKSWGNPSSEIISILYQYRGKLQVIDIEPLIEHAVSYLNKKEAYKSEHEIYCYLRMYKKLPGKYQKQMKGSISKAIKELICLDSSQWGSYVPKPLDFVQSKGDPFFAEIEAYAEMNCDYLVDTIQEGIWYPTWSWNQYEEQWEKSKVNWAAVLTINNFRILSAFDRIE